MVLPREVTTKGMQCHRAGFLHGLRLRGSPSADDDAKRRLLEIVCLNCTLDGATLVRELRKPFDVLAEGLLSEKSRGDKTAIELFVTGIRGWEAGLRRQVGDD
jgi:hypothetical protein